jgi:hypothetical protein
VPRKAPGPWWPSWVVTIFGTPHLPTPVLGLDELLGNTVGHTIFTKLEGAHDESDRSGSVPYRDRIMIIGEAKNNGRVSPNLSRTVEFGKTVALLCLGKRLVCCLLLVQQAQHCAKPVAMLRTVAV